MNQRTTTGLFSQGNYQLTDTFEVQVGGRYSTYKATGRGFVTIGRGVPGFPADGLPVADLSGDNDDARFTGKVALNWKLEADNLLYALVARGYKPGGFNSTTSTFDPETVMSYEAGWKSSFFGERVRTQLSAFYNKYKGFQFNVVEPSTDFSGVENIADVTIKGFEAQVQARVRGFGFDANVAYVDSIWRASPSSIRATCPPARWGRNAVRARRRTRRSASTTIPSSKYRATGRTCTRPNGRTISARITASRSAARR